MAKLRYSGLTKQQDCNKAALLKLNTFVITLLVLKKPQDYNNKIIHFNTD